MKTLTFLVIIFTSMTAIADNYGYGNMDNMGYDDTYMGYDDNMGYDANMGYDDANMGYDDANMGYDHNTIVNQSYGNNNIINQSNGGSANVGSITIDGNVISSSSSSGIKGSGRVISKKRSLKSFNKIVSNIVADINVISSKRYHMTIKGDDNIIKNISSKVVKNQLKIIPKKSYSTQNPIKVTIEMPVLKEIRQSGSGNISLDNVSKERLSIKVIGTGNVSARGKVKHLDALIDGSGQLNLADLKSRRASIVIEGVGNAFVDVAEHLDARINGLGDVIVSGRPTVRQAIQGMGRVRHRK